MHLRHLVRPFAPATLIVTTLLLGACGGAAETAAATPAAAGQGEGARGLPSTHVHDVGRDTGDGALLLATHDGLYRYTSAGAVRVGPQIDLMGFTVVGPNHYYASGHPNAVMDLPQPLGLVESRDGGRTWTVLSRGGESDFHALTKAGDTVVAFDGQLRRTTNGQQWVTGAIPAVPRVLASSPAGKQVLATTETGLLSSNDSGATWAAVSGAPLLHLVAWADEQTAVGVTPDGTVALSHDGARTWRTKGRISSAPQALSANVSAAGLEMVVVTDRDVLSSRDGTSFTSAAPTS